jgi:uncharacterized membrane protein
MDNRLHPDRINNFCDAVFAIAMTLLILEIKVPDPIKMKSIGLLGSLEKLTPSFISFLISFLVIALYWRAHLTISKFAKEYHNQQLWLTIWLLLFIVLLPFSTALYSAYFNDNHSFIFYCCNLTAIGIIHFFLTKSILANRPKKDRISKELVRLMILRTILPPLIWVLSIIWVFVEPYSARFLFLLIFISQFIVNKKFEKIAPAEN